MPGIVWFESSGFERSIISANAIGQGLFTNVAPNSTTPVSHVPVYTLNPWNDVTMRAYETCNSFVASLAELYQSPEWRALESTHDSFLRRLALISNFRRYADSRAKVPLAELWSIYDAIQVAKAECADGETDMSSPCNPERMEPELKDILTDAEWQTLQSIVQKTETLRYNSEVAGRLIGQNLLMQVLLRMTVAGKEDVSLPQGGGLFYLYSAHYPIILGVLAALGKEPLDTYNAVPSFSTAIIFELHEEQGVDVVKVFYRTGPTSEPIDIAFSIVAGICGDLRDSCPLSQFMELFEEWTQERWCVECSNYSADICIRLMFELCEESKIESVGAAMIGVASGLVTGLIGAAIFLCYRRRRSAPVAIESAAMETTGISI